jgi:hypothetical protein
MPATEEQEFNSEIIGGGLHSWYGPEKTGYDIGFGWTLNPWSECYGCIDVWEVDEKGEFKIVDRMEPDTNWHALIVIMDKKNNCGFVVVDGNVYEISKLHKTYHPEFGTDISAGIPCEAVSIWPGEEATYGAIGRMQVKNWFWIWIPYNTYQYFLPIILKLFHSSTP